MLIYIQHQFSDFSYCIKPNIDKCLIKTIIIRRSLIYLNKKKHFHIFGKILSSTQFI